MAKRETLALCAAVLIGLGPWSIGWAQDKGKEKAQNKAEATPTAGDQSLINDEEVDVSRIDEILRGDQQVQGGEIFSYDPAGRRDPFKSLLDSRNTPDEEGGHVRPPGLPGMMIDELKIEGIIETPTGSLAFVLGRDNLSYIIRPGTKLFNGEVTDIQSDRVIFKQLADDPKQSRPYEEVVRVLADD